MPTYEVEVGQPLGQRDEALVKRSAMDASGAGLRAAYGAENVIRHQIGRRIPGSRQPIPSRVRCLRICKAVTCSALFAVSDQNLHPRRVEPLTCTDLAEGIVQYLPYGLLTIATIPVAVEIVPESTEVGMLRRQLSDQHLVATLHVGMAYPCIACEAGREFQKRRIILVQGVELNHISNELVQHC